MLRGSVLVHEGHRDEAITVLQQGLAGWEATGSRLALAYERARSQGAKCLELRAAMSLARLLQQQGRVAEGKDLLAQCYAWFTEGFDTPDLLEASVLLDQLTKDDGGGDTLRRESGRVTNAAHRAPG